MNNCLMIKYDSKIYKEKNNNTPGKKLFKLHYENIIKDLKQKGFNPSQIKDIITSIQNSSISKKGSQININQKTIKGNRMNYKKPNIIYETENSVVPTKKHDQTNIVNYIRNQTNIFNCKPLFFSKVNNNLNDQNTYNNQIFFQEKKYPSYDNRKPNKNIFVRASNSPQCQIKKHNRIFNEYRVNNKNFNNKITDEDKNNLNFHKYKNGFLDIKINSPNNYYGFSNETNDKQKLINKCHKKTTYSYSNIFYANDLVNNNITSVDTKKTKNKKETLNLKFSKITHQQNNKEKNKQNNFQIIDSNKYRNNITIKDIHATKPEKIKPINSSFKNLNCKRFNNTYYSSNNTFHFINESKTDENIKHKNVKTVTVVYPFNESCKKFDSYISVKTISQNSRRRKRNNYIIYPFSQNKIVDNSPRSTSWNNNKIFGTLPLNYENLKLNNKYHFNDKKKPNIHNNISNSKNRVNNDEESKHEKKVMFSRLNKYEKNKKLSEKFCSSNFQFMNSPYHNISTKIISHKSNGLINKNNDKFDGKIMDKQLSHNTNIIIESEDYNNNTIFYSFAKTENIINSSNEELINQKNNNICKINFSKLPSKKKDTISQNKNKSPETNNLNKNNVNNNNKINTYTKTNSSNKEISHKTVIKQYEDGKYEGILINNKREIHGIMYYKNGAKYDGQWKNNKINGKGIYISGNYFKNDPNLIGIKYEGDFKNDKIEGFGTGIYTSGDKYTGEWKDNKQYGRGIVEYRGGGKYDGEWKNGKFNGHGIYVLKNGEKFEGKFIDNKYNGYGKYYYLNGDILEGIFKNDRPSGNCVLHRADGTIENQQFPV